MKNKNSKCIISNFPPNTNKLLISLSQEKENQNFLHLRNKIYELKLKKEKGDRKEHSHVSSKDGTSRQFSHEVEPIGGVRWENRGFFLLEPRPPQGQGQG